MRVIADIPHPQLKITVFHMNFKYAVKFETPLYEQWYKIRESAIINSPRDVIQMVDEAMIADVIKIMGSMHENNIQTHKRLEQNHLNNSDQIDL